MSDAEVVKAEIELPTDLNGHDCGGIDRDMMSSVLYRGASVEHPRRVYTGSSGRCGHCGATVDLMTDGARCFTTAAPCPCPNGAPVSEFFLNVPSGKLVVANDLRALFPCDEPHDSINLAYGRHTFTMAYAEVGMAHGSVGNTCPSVSKLGDKLWIGAAPPEAVEVASVITDLWWYSIVDYDEFVRRAAHYYPRKSVRSVLKEFYCQVVEVTPGAYLVRHDDNVDRSGSGEDAEYATFERVGAPLPVVDYLAIERAKCVTPEQYVAQSARDWPTLYSLENMERVADQIMCTTGNGVDWHENGHPRTRLDSDIAANPRPINIPTFIGPGHWYPISAGFCTLSLAAGIQSEHGGGREEVRLAPGFAKLAFNVLQCMIWWGSVVGNWSQSTPAEVEARTREQLKLAVRIYWALAERYPHAASEYPEFAEWMMSNDAQLDEYCDTVELVSAEEHAKAYEARRSHDSLALDEILSESRELLKKHQEEKSNG